MISRLKDVLERAATWPEQAQQELAEIVLEIDAEFRGGVYHATADELKAIDEADRSGVATPKQVEAAFRSFRRAWRLESLFDRIVGRRTGFHFA